jgi:hypothetical protein
MMTAAPKAALGLLNLAVFLVFLFVALEAALLEDGQDLLFKVHLASVLSTGGIDGGAEAKHGSECEGECVFHGWCETGRRAKMFTRIFRGQAATLLAIEADSQK